MAEHVTFNHGVAGSNPAWHTNNNLEDIQVESLYYSHPVQIRYWNTIHQEYEGAIAYQDYLIRGDTGRLIPLQEIIEAAAYQDISADGAIIELDWIDIGESILGS